jgi:hypothetical protein
MPTLLDCKQIAPHTPGSDQACLLVVTRSYEYTGEVIPEIGVTMSAEIDDVSVDCATCRAPAVGYGCNLPGSRIRQPYGRAYPLLAVQYLAAAARASPMVVGTGRWPVVYTVRHTKLQSTD